MDYLDVVAGRGWRWGVFVKRTAGWLVGLGVLALLTWVLGGCSEGGEVTVSEGGFGGWDKEEIRTLESLWLGSLPPLPPDPSNRVGDDPRAAELGQRIFFDTRFSATGEVSCNTCHIAPFLFIDNLSRAEAIGTTDRHTPTIVGTAYSPWFFWDGRRDSQWSQALAPMESAVEHGGTRTEYAHLIAEDETYRAAYETIFGPMPDLSDRERFPKKAGPVEDPELRAAWEGMAPADQGVVNEIFANIGKAIAAYERLIMPGPSRFDDYVAALRMRDEDGMAASLDENEVAGLRLFIGKGNCIQCHNGPLFTNNGFHSIGVPDGPDRPPDIGRFGGVQLVVDDEFNCLGSYSDAPPEECRELRFVKKLGPELMAAFKVPTLRNVADTWPYMHAGQFGSLEQVLDHYNQAPVGQGPTAHTDLVPLDLTQIELDQLEAFLGSLSGPLQGGEELLAPLGD